MFEGVIGKTTRRGEGKSSQMVQTVILQWSRGHIREARAGMWNVCATTLRLALSPLPTMVQVVILLHGTPVLMSSGLSSE